MLELSLYWKDTEDCRMLCVSRGSAGATKHPFRAALRMKGGRAGTRMPNRAERRMPIHGATIPCPRLSRSRNRSVVAEFIRYDPCAPYSRQIEAAQEPWNRRSMNTKHTPPADRHHGQVPTLQVSTQAGALLLFL